jgi:hypothetical protein
MYDGRRHAADYVRGSVRGQTSEESRQRADGSRQLVEVRVSNVASATNEFSPAFQGRVNVEPNAAASRQRRLNAPVKLRRR